MEPANGSRQPERTLVIRCKAELGEGSRRLHGLHSLDCGIEQRPIGCTGGFRIAVGGEGRPVANPGAGKLELFRVQKMCVEEVQDFGRVICPQGENSPLRLSHRPRAGRDDLAARTQPGTRRRTGPSPRRPLRLGAAARPHLRSVPARVSDLWRRDAHHRLHHRRPTVRDILVHLGEPTAPPRIAPARGPPLWEATGTAHDPSADPLLQSAPAFEFDQRLTW